MDPYSLKKLADEGKGGRGEQVVESNDDDNDPLPGLGDYPHATLASLTILPQVKDPWISAPTSITQMGGGGLSPIGTTVP